MENKLKELETLIEVVNHISNNIYESTFATIAKEAKEDKENYILQGRIDFLYSFINNILKNSEDIAILENKIYDILCIRSSADADDYSIIEFNKINGICEQKALFFVIKKQI